MEGGRAGALATGGGAAFSLFGCEFVRATEVRPLTVPARRLAIDEEGRVPADDAGRDGDKED